MSARKKVLVGSDVYLNVYDMNDMNDYLYNIGFGLFHTGVEINGVEYSFGEEAGISKGEPKQAGDARFRESINMGVTYFSNSEIDRKIDTLRDIYRGDQYHVVLKNCNHFSNDLCLALLDTPIPSYINRCASIASWFSCLFPRPQAEEEQIKRFSGHGNRLDNRTHSSDTNTVRTVFICDV